MPIFFGELNGESEAFPLVPNTLAHVADVNTMPAEVVVDLQLGLRNSHCMLRTIGQVPQQTCMAHGTRVVVAHRNRLGWPVRIAHPIDVYGPALRGVDLGELLRHSLEPRGLALIISGPDQNLALLLDGDQAEVTLNLLAPAIEQEAEVVGLAIPTS